MSLVLRRLTNLLLNERKDKEESVWAGNKGSVCFKNTGGHVKIGAVRMRERGFASVKGYWWSRWGPPGPSRWPSDSSSARWCSSPARHDSPDQHSNQQTLTDYRYDANIVLRLCASSFSLPLQNSTTLFSLKIWHVGGKALKPGRQSPDVQMMSGTEFVVRNTWTTTKRFIKYWFNEADLLTKHAVVFQEYCVLIR